ncbi:hypothetical protein COI17_12580 [Neisseria meningitidis]|nr:hypothetical protein COI17_12580 [Neisseria meningitidis]
MNKTWKRQVFRHTALYTAILMFSHTGGGGGGAGANVFIQYCNERTKAARSKEWEPRQSTQSTPSYLYDKF